MPLLKKFITSNKLENSPINIIFLSEGYNKSINLFLNDCFYFKKYVQRYAPFNLSAIINNIQILYFYEKSTINLNLSNSEPTKIGSYIKDEKWTFDKGKFENLLDSLTLKNNGEKLKLTNFLNKGMVNNIVNRTLVCVLSPPEIFGVNQMQVYEPNLKKENYYYLATSTYKHWPQVIIKSIGKMLGLNDEFLKEEKIDISKLDEFDIYYLDQLYPNSDYNKINSKGDTKKGYKWSYLLTKEQQEQPIDVFKKTNINYKYSDNAIGLFELSEVDNENFFVPSSECLMHINFNLQDDLLKIFNNKIGFCPICENHLIRQITEDSDFLFKTNFIN